LLKIPEMKFYLSLLALLPLVASQLFSEKTTTQRYLLDGGVWQDYLTQAPEIWIVGALPAGPADLLQRQQALAARVLNLNVTTDNPATVARLQHRLDDLKTMIPSDEVQTGRVERSERSGSRHWYYDAFGTQVWRSGPSYTVMREVSRSSSPELTRSVIGLAMNIELADLEVRIAALEGTYRTWLSRTNQMSTSQTQGIIRQANLSYLENLNEFIGQLRALKREYDAIQVEASRGERERAQRIAEWSAFEQRHLPVLHSFLEQGGIQRYVADDAGFFHLPPVQPGELKILACSMGPRTLFFDANNRQHHPLQLLPFGLAGSD
jgi:hypothetical protein